MSYMAKLSPTVVLWYGKFPDEAALMKLKVDYILELRSTLKALRDHEDFDVYDTLDLPDIPKRRRVGHWVMNVLPILNPPFRVITKCTNVMIEAKRHEQVVLLYARGRRGMLEAIANYYFERITWGI